MQRWQHCKLVGNKVSFLGASGVFDNRADAHLSNRTAWSKLEEEGWELVTAIVAPETEELTFFFKRPAPAEA